LILPFVVYPIFVMRLLTLALFACAFNLVIGYVGLLSAGHAAFWGMAGYCCGWALKVWHVDAMVAIAIGGMVGAVLGLVMGYLAIRRSGMYFAMITLARAQIVYFFCIQAPFTEGENGMQRIPRSTILGLVSLDDNLNMYWLTAAIFVAGFLLVHRVIHSPFGQVMKAIRENEPRAISLGYRVQDYKLIAFVLSAFLSGIAGATSTLVFGIATSEGVSFARTGDVILTTLLGGLGTVFGPVVGAIAMTSMERYLAQFGSWITVTQGTIFIVCVLVFRRGIVGELAAKLKLSL
jgi:branched-chain amino acid transport system permease protein